MEFSVVMETVGKSLDAVGVAVIVLGAFFSAAVAARNLARGDVPVYHPFRQQLGRSILLGLEFLVAADIIRSVAIAPTFSSVGVLALIVLVRTFLSFSLELELTGRWPWQKRSDGDVATGDRSASRA